MWYALLTFNIVHILDEPVFLFFCELSTKVIIWNNRYKTSSQYAYRPLLPAKFNHELNQLSTSRVIVLFRVNALDDTHTQLLGKYIYYVLLWHYIISSFGHTQHPLFLYTLVLRNNIWFPVTCITFCKRYRILLQEAVNIMSFWRIRV